MTKSSTLTKRLHIAVLIFGAALFSVCAANANIWFDECYSLAAVSCSASDIVSVLTDDVHPFLYYFLLKAVYHLTGHSLFAMRLFSAFGMWLLALAGYTHVRRYISARVGLLFSLFCVLSPASIKYAGEIRMYSFGALFAFFAAFYAYLSLSSPTSGTAGSESHGTPHRSVKLVLFAVFSVATAYTHYYGLVTVCVINAFFIVAAIAKKLRAGEILATCAAQLLLYIPGFAVFITQSTRVAGGEYWIRVKYPDVLFQTLSYAATGGDSPWDCYMSTNAYSAVAVFACVLFIAAVAATLRGMLKRDKNARAAALALGVFCSVVGAGLAVSIFKEFYYVRYTMLCHGMLLLSYAYAASRIKRGHVTAALCVLIAVASTAVCRPFFAAMHNGDAARATDSIRSAFGEDDVLLFESITQGAVVSYMLDGGTQYYINDTLEEYPRAYTAFDSFTTVASLENIGKDTLSETLSSGARLWILEKDGDDATLVTELERLLPDAVRTEELTLTVLYRHNTLRLAAYSLGAD